MKTNSRLETVSDLSAGQAGGTDTFTHAYDSDGNRTSGDGLDLAWDAENRLIQIAPAFPLEGDRRIRYAYDPLGRRVRKTVAKHTDRIWSKESETHYTYWDWTKRGSAEMARSQAVLAGRLRRAPSGRRNRNVIEEHRSPAGSPSETRRLVWGEDLGGRFQTAGGVGGLLVQSVSGGIHNGARWHYHYDGNGNVTELTDRAGSTVATYRYTAFGDIWSATGTAAQANHYRFSTKPIDDEVVSAASNAFFSGLYYYGYRFYDPGLGRWFNRDPLEEWGGVNLYGFVYNDSVNWIDVLGLRIPVFRPPPRVGRRPPPGRPRLPNNRRQKPPWMGPGHDPNETRIEDPDNPSKPWWENIDEVFKRAWTCDAKCNGAQAKKDACCPEHLTGSGFGHSQSNACIAAKRNATGSAPSGCYGRHCRCLNCRKL